ncbi:LacI family DNA-binding transcriptional regulator [Teredinibacter turnerae]|uniref:LacI family DNA-binding transcriptional regulator n=1 Tax=Teredinibacter turnerae TaxID=2426 RepID=UPI00036AE052|nr:LacI family DNA-binding transcriptional regulator [Teredinibacter turnerae]
MSKKASGVSRKKMSDIARLAGVSESTVSRALNDSPLINIETRKRIQALARQHNYSINKQARNLRLQSSRTIAVMIPMHHAPGQHVSDPFFMELLGAIADALTEADFDMLLSRVHRDDWRSKVESYNHVDGVIIIGQSDLHADINDFAMKSQLPLVVWGAHLEGQAYVTIGSDNHLGGHLAAEHLLAQGRRRLVFIGDVNLPEVGMRCEGFTSVLREAGIAEDEIQFVPCGFSLERAHQAMDQLLEDTANLRFDGIFAASDVLASVAIRRLGAAGIAVPGSVSVVGFDDVPVAELMMPPLTTISQVIHTSGYRLVANLFSQIQGDITESEVIAPELIIRGST